MREISIAEKRHIEEFSDRILFLQGDVDMNASFRTKQVTEVKEMLRMAMQLEQSTIDSYNEASRLAAEHKDAVTHKMRSSISTPSAPSCKTCWTTAKSIWPCSRPPAASARRRASDTRAAANSRSRNGTFRKPDRFTGTDAIQFCIRPGIFISLASLRRF